MITSIESFSCSLGGVMAQGRSKNSNFNLPIPLFAEYDRMCNELGEKSKVKWAVAAAAIVELLKLPDATKRERIGRLIGARFFDGEIEKIVQAAKDEAAPATTSELSDPGDAIVNRPSQQPAPGHESSRTPAPRREQAQARERDRAGRHESK